MSATDFCVVADVDPESGLSFLWRLQWDGTAWKVTGSDSMYLATEEVARLARTAGSEVVEL